MKTYKIHKSTLLVCFAVVAIGVVLQLLLGNCNAKFFAFPLNILLLFATVFFVHGLRTLKGKPQYFKQLSSLEFAACAMILLIAASLVIGLVIQKQPNNFAQNTDFLSRLGIHHFTTSWIFIFILLFFSVVLTAVVSAHFHFKTLRNCLFLFWHVGLLLAVWGAFWGAADEREYRIIADRQEFNSLAYNEKSEPAHLPFYVRLSAFNVDYYPSGEPKYFSAKLLLRKSADDEITDGETRVNKPFNFNGYKIYLLNYDVVEGDSSSYCVLMMVRQPWQFVIVLGIIFMIIASVLSPVVLLKINKVSGKTPIATSEIKNDNVE